MITKVQNTGQSTPNSTSVVKAFASNVAVGDLIVVLVGRWSASSDPIVVGDLAKSGGTATIDDIRLDSSGASFEETTDSWLTAAVLSAVVTGAGSLELTVSGGPSGSYWMMGIASYSPGADTWDATRVEDADAGQGTTGAPVTGEVTSAAAALIAGIVMTATSVSTTHTAAGPFTEDIFEQEDGANQATGNAAYGIVSGATTDAGEWSDPTTRSFRCVVVVYKVTPAAGGGWETHQNLTLVF